MKAVSNRYSRQTFDKQVDPWRLVNISLLSHQEAPQVLQVPVATILPIMAIAIVVDRSKRIFRCPPCQRPFLTEQSLLQHCRATGRHFWCERCKCVFDDNNDLQDHLNYNAIHRTCDICGRVFSSSNNLKMVRVSHFAGFEELTRLASHHPQNCKHRVPLLQPRVQDLLRYANPP
jgi:hypothetical protein